MVGYTYIVLRIAFWYTVRDAQSLNYVIEHTQNSNFIKNYSLLGQNSFMLINIIVTSIVKTIV